MSRTDSGDRADGDSVERTLSDDPDQRAADAAMRRSDERVRHSDPRVRAELRRRRRRTNRIYLGVALAVVTLLVGYVALYFLPVLAVRQIDVTGNVTVESDLVRERANVSLGTPLLQVDAHAVAQRIAGIPEVSEVTVRRNYPTTLEVQIVQREALVRVEIGGAEHLIDAEGVDFGQGLAAPDTPLLRIDDDVRDRLPELTRQLAGVFEAARTHAGLHIVEAEIGSPNDFSIVIEDGRRIEWGAPEDHRAKAEAAALVLTQPGETWNVSNPAMPVAR